MSLAERNIAYRRKTADQRKQDLVEAGITCLGKGGISAFTIDQICREAEVSRGLINHHFKSKEDLLVRIYADMTAHLVEVTPGQRARERLLSIIDNSFDVQSFNTTNLRAWLAIWAEVANNKALYALHRERYQVYTRLIATALDDISGSDETEINCDRLARQVVALIDGLWLEYCLHSEGFTLEDARQDCLDLLNANGVELEQPAATGGSN